MVLPPGYRFCPSDEQLVMVFLKKKVFKEPLPHDHIIDVFLYEQSPDELAVKYKDLVEPWYFFTPRDRKYNNGSRPNRMAGHTVGYWKATGSDVEITSQGSIVGYKKRLVFFYGKHPNGEKTNWIMHEFRLDRPSHVKQHLDDMTLDDWVLCRIYNKDHKGSAKGSPKRPLLVRTEGNNSAPAAKRPCVTMINGNSNENSGSDGINRGANANEGISATHVLPSNDIITQFEEWAAVMERQLTSMDAQCDYYGTNKLNPCDCSNADMISRCDYSDKMLSMQQLPAYPGLSSAAHTIDPILDYADANVINRRDYFDNHHEMLRMQEQMSANVISPHWAAWPAGTNLVDYRNKSVEELMTMTFNPPSGMTSTSDTSMIDPNDYSNDPNNRGSSEMIMQQQPRVMHAAASRVGIVHSTTQTWPTSDMAEEKKEGDHDNM